MRKKRYKRSKEHIEKIRKALKRYYKLYPQKHHWYKDGNTLGRHKKHYCKCGKEINYRSERCYSCENKRKHKIGVLKSDGENNPNYKKKIKIKCLQCKKLFKIIPARKTTAIFCSNKCKYNWRSIDENKRRYSRNFTKNLKNKIRIRDNYECQNCGMTQEEHFIVYKRDIEIHHMDYNRKNCNKNNLITLCKQCNIRANYNRKYWIRKFKKILKNR